MMGDGIKTQILYAAVRPDGTVMGPVGDRPGFVRKSLKIGHKRAGESGKWSDIVGAGYSIWKVSIAKIEKVNP